MDDLKRLKNYYNNRSLEENYWQDFNCLPFYLSCTQYKMIINILKKNGIDSASKLFGKFIMDIGAGEGNFLLSFLRLGANVRNLTAVELLEQRFNMLQEKVPNANLYNKNYLDLDLNHSFDIITIMAVLTSILDDSIRNRLVEKAYKELARDGILIIYDYDRLNPVQMSPNYKAISFRRIIRDLGLKRNEYKIYKNCYINLRIGKILCVLGLGFIIPFLQSFKIFNDSYSFLVIRK